MFTTVERIKNINKFEQRLLTAAYGVKLVQKLAKINSESIRKQPKSNFSIKGLLLFHKQTKDG